MKRRKTSDKRGTTSIVEPLALVVQLHQILQSQISLCRSSSTHCLLCPSSSSSPHSEDGKSESDSGSLSPAPPSTEIKPKLLPTILGQGQKSALSGRSGSPITHNTDGTPGADDQEDESDLESLTDSNAGDKANDEDMEGMDEDAEVGDKPNGDEGSGISQDQDQDEEEDDDEDGDITMKADAGELADLIHNIEGEGAATKDLEVDQPKDEMGTMEEKNEDDQVIDGEQGAAEEPEAEAEAETEEAPSESPSRVSCDGLY